ncbi:MAG: hypothetical protein O3C45_03550 [Bacteroidetes bacterium]|nr:hypothetical protein [Bacteroidota bacterium]MDA0874116.1 hypothetical protein [Bacteroidota bacterium]
MTKSELEERLRAKADAISGRIGKLESSLPGANLKIPAVLKDKRNLKIGAAVGAGFLVGYLLLNRRSRSARGDYSEQLTRLADRLGDAIAERLRRDMGTDDAVRDALDEVPPMVELQSAKQGVLGTAVRQLVRSGSSALVSEMSKWLQESVLEEKKHPKEDAD